MDYEKKYNDALDWMRKVYPTLNGSAKEDAEHYFPELKDSEDERIRKEIIEFIDWAESRGSVRNDWHQKKRPAEWIAYLERQKEQKPAEWSEFDKGALKDAICAADRLGNDESFKKSNPNLAKAFRVAKDWLKSLPERFTLQPEQEVVDRTVFDRIADILRWCDLPIGCPIEDFKQSESEREHLLHIVQCVAHRYANSCTYCKEYSRGYQDGLAVPHWKPSEKQINALQAFVGMIHPDARYDAVFGLLEELKAL